MISVGSTPLPIINVVLTALSDTRLSTLSSVRALAVMAEYADEHGNIQPFPSGEMVTDPDIMSAKIGVTKNAIFNAYNALQDHGYIAWNKARGNERSRGITGRVRILVPSAQ
jgi:hypothetical protein